MDKLLVVGAGIGQVPLVKRAKALGVYVIVVTRAGDYPAIFLADEAWYIDIYDYEAIVEKARVSGVTAVISDQNDLMMPTVAYVAEALGLPGNSQRATLSYCNKNKFREICDKEGVPAPRHVELRSSGVSYSELPFEVPLMVKPADSQSSIAVCKVCSFDEFEKALDAALEASPTGSAIVEEFFEGTEVVCEGFVDDGRYRNLAIGDRKYFDLGERTMIPSQTLFPSNLSREVAARIIDCEERLTAAIGASFGIVHSEYLVNGDGDICVVESAIRGGGVYISSHIVPLATGVDVNALLLDKALGRQVDVESAFNAGRPGAAGYVCFYLPEGVVEECCGIEELVELPFVDMACLNDLTVGRKTGPMTYKGQRLGPVIVTGSDRANLDRNVQEVQSILSVIVRTSEGAMEGLRWA